MGKMRGEDWRGMVRCKSKSKLRCTRFWFILVAFAKKYQCTGEENRKKKKKKKREKIVMTFKRQRLSHDPRVRQHRCWQQICSASHRVPLAGISLMIVVKVGLD